MLTIYKYKGHGLIDWELTFCPKCKAEIGWLTDTPRNCIFCENPLPDPNIIAENSISRLFFHANNGSKK